MSGIVATTPASAAHAAAPPLAAAELFAINGARLGMSFRAWQALPRPGPAPDHIVTDCKPDREGAGRVRAGTPRLECRYVARYGDYALPVSFPLIGRRRMRKPVFEFVGGRLAGIRFRTTVDAFNQVMAVLQQGYGPPQRIVRDSVRIEGVALPRVRASWRTAGGIVTLTDPSPNPERLEVRLGAASAEPDAG